MVCLCMYVRMQCMHTKDFPKDIYAYMHACMYVCMYVLMNE